MFQAAFVVTILVVFDCIHRSTFLRAIEVNQLFLSADRKNMNASKYGKRPKKKEVLRTMPFRRCPIWHAVLAFLPIRRAKMDTRSFRPLSFHSRNNSLLRILICEIFFPPHAFAKVVSRSFASIGKKTHTATVSTPNGL